MQDDFGLILRSLVSTAQVAETHIPSPLRPGNLWPHLESSRKKGRILCWRPFFCSFEGVPTFSVCPESPARCMTRLEKHFRACPEKLFIVWEGVGWGRGGGEGGPSSWGSIRMVWIFLFRELQTVAWAPDSLNKDYFSFQS